MDNEKPDNKKDWSEEIIKFYNSEEYQKLNEYYNRSTIFDALGIQRSETIHSKFLKWLLDPNSNHQLSDIPLRKFLRMLSTKNIDEQLKTKFLSNKSEIIIDEIETERVSYKLENTNSYGRIDLFISLKIGGDDVAIVVENKIKAKERDTIDISNDDTAITYYEKKYGETDINTLKKVGQTVLYQFWAETKTQSGKHSDSNKVYVYLTPEGKQCLSKDYVSVKYQEIVDNVIEPILSMSLAPQIAYFIEDYLRTLGKPTLDEKDESTIIATSKREVGYLNELGEKFKDFISIVLENRKFDKSELNEGTRLKNFWKENKNLLLSILKETDPSKYKELKKEKPTITYKGKQFDNFSSFVWQVIKDYVVEKNVLSLDVLETTFKTGNKKGISVQMFATEDEFKSFQTANSSNYWQQREPINLNGMGNIYVTSTWLTAEDAHRNHSQQVFIDTVKNILKYPFDIE